MRFVALILFGLIANLALGTTLIVDDFPTSVDWQSQWADALAVSGIDAQVAPAEEVIDSEPATANLVLWNCGSDGTLSEDERAWIQSFLENGGNLLLCTSRAAQELIPDNHEWMIENLGLDFVIPDSPITWSSAFLDQTIAGLDDTPFEGMELTLHFGEGDFVAADGLNTIHTASRHAEHILELDDLAGNVGVAFETPIHRAITISFPIDSIIDEGLRLDVLGKSIEWLTRPRFEGRGIWVVRNQIDSPERIDRIVESSAAAGANALYVQVRGRGDAFYESATEPRSDELENAPEDFDPLAYSIERGHAAGLEIHAWMNAGYTWYPRELPEDSQHIINRHPEWVMVNRAGKSMIDYEEQEFHDAYAEGRYLSLAAPEVQDYLADVYLEVVENYDVDGLHFDFIRCTTRGVSPEYDLDYNPLAIAAFEDEMGYSPLDVEIDTPEYIAWTRWYMRRIGELVGTIREQAHEAHPGIRVSAAVLSRYHLARAHALQDWILWAREGWVDTLCLMAYDADNHLVTQEALLAEENRGEATVWVGLGLRDGGEGLFNRIEMVREEVDPEGIMIFSWRGLNEDKFDGLRRAWAAPAEVPPVED